MSKKQLTKQEKNAAMLARNKRLQMLMHTEKLHEENRKTARAQQGPGGGFEHVKPQDGGLMGTIGRWTNEIGALRGQISKSRDLYRKKGKAAGLSR